MHFSSFLPLAAANDRCNYIITIWIIFISIFLIRKISSYSWEKIRDFFKFWFWINGFLLIRQFHFLGEKMTLKISPAFPILIFIQRTSWSLAARVSLERKCSSLALRALLVACQRSSTKLMIVESKKRKSR